MMTRLSTRKRLAQEQVPGSSSQQVSGIVWLGEPWICSKQLKHYSAFVVKRTKIPEYSFVWIKGEENKHYLGYLVDMYEDQQGEKMVRARLFANSGRFESRIPNLRPETREVFITPVEQDISAECIDGVAALLTPAHFKECDEFLPQVLSLKNLMCYREHKNNEVKPFSLSTLRGYATQPILYTLRCEVNRRRTNRGKSTELVQGSGAHTDLPIPGNQEAKGEPSQQKPVDNTLGAPAQQPQSQWLPIVGNNIELLSQDSGMRGCWLRCKILRSTQNRLKVQYYDIDNVDGARKLEEWVPASRVAAPDTSGVRSEGRLTVRPWPDWESTDLRYVFGEAVDAWCDNGWWEGLVIGRDPSRESNFQLYFPDEKKFLPVERKHLRVSKDWVENKWVSLNPKADLLVFLTQLLNQVVRPPLPIVAGPVPNEGPSSSRRGESRQIEGDLPSSSNAAANQNDVDELNVNKVLVIGNNEEMSQRGSGNAEKDDRKGKGVLQ